MMRFTASSQAKKLCDGELVGPWLKFEKNLEKRLLRHARQQIIIEFLSSPLHHV
jgi:hypothetical protein